LISARQPQDRVITAYRDHGVAINAGIPANKVVAELLGKATGISKGKGGSMHMADVTKNYWGGHAIVGAHLPLAVGMALADQYEKRDAVTIAMFGDGSTNIGFFHEALNLSKVWELPVLWVVENNKYGMGTAVERASAVTEIRQKACGYDIKSERADGMNLFEMHEVTSRMLKEIREGSGPQFLEAETYRFRGHSMGDPERYRDTDEIHKYQENDPIGIARKQILANKLATEQELNEMDTLAMDEVLEAVAYAENSPEPAPEELFTDVYAEDEVRS
jgi:pyruvate dehydrogenase E1 component alpha subunit